MFETIAEASGYASVGIVDGHVAMSTSGDVDISVKRPENTPLSSGETQAIIKVSGDDYRAEVELDQDALDAVVDALTAGVEGDA